MMTPNIERALAANGVRSFTKRIVREGMTYDCVDAVNDLRFALYLLEERTRKILNEPEPEGN
jgi:hypothetical protein